MKLLEDLFTAYYDARRNKRNTLNQLKFEINLENNILKLYHQLKDRTYKVGRCVAFIIEQPIKREVFAANFADRVIHHLYFNYINEIFEKTFIEDSYSCRKGRGTMYGIERIDHHIRSCSKNYTKECYVLKLDLSGYFMSIDRQILYDKVVSTLLKFADRKNNKGEKYSDILDYDLLIFLSREIIFHDPVSNCFIKGDMSEWEGLPSDKSLFTTKQGCGLPIGNLTSQLFSNVYLNDFDQYVKRELKIKHYGRYVDDFFIIHNSKRYLVELIGTLRDYLKEHFGIVMHPRKIYLQNIFRGVVFLGTVVKPHRIYVLKRTVSNFKKSMALGQQGHYGDNPVKLLQMLNSYLGLMVHHKTFNIRKSIIEKNGWIFRHGWICNRYKRFVLDESDYRPFLQSLPEEKYQCDFNSDIPENMVAIENL